ncbi:MAG: DUF1932 domain-containing protein [Shinella sp.]|uniref:DUF1932 domain-containing protein n=1 Tax=Shinella sp. TaxID=1870904 RepID=UPI004036E681
MSDTLRVGFIGFGEIGRILAPGLKAAGHPSVVVHDPFLGAEQRYLAEANGVGICGTLDELCGWADLILGVTPGSQSLRIATALEPLLNARHTYLDVASTTPAIKSQVFDRLSPTGACIGDAVIVGAVSQGLALSILACGPGAPAMIDELTPFGMSIREVPGPCGTAASIKIIRSVAMKGFAMLVFEALSAARRYGVEKDVLSSLDETFARPFHSYVDRLVSGSLKHAVRRHEEVEMSAETLRDVSLAPLMTEATIARFAELAVLASDPANRPTIERLQQEGWQASVDWLQPRLRPAI